MCFLFPTCCLSTAFSLFSKLWRSEVTSLRSSFSLFMITCTFSCASRHSLPWARICSDLCVCGSWARGFEVTSSWAESSCRDDTFCWDSSSSCLICCKNIRQRERFQHNNTNSIKSSRMNKHKGLVRQHTHSWGVPLTFCDKLVMSHEPVLERWALLHSSCGLCSPATAADRGSSHGTPAWGCGK